MSSTINSFTRAGSTFLNAWGMMISFMVCVKFRPRLRPASVCPGSMDIIPERTISATYAPELIPKARLPTMTLSRLTDPKITKFMIRSWIMVGVPRITVRYTLQTAFRILKCPDLSWVERMMATMNPRMIPRIAAKNVMSSVVFRPSSSHR